MNVSLRRRRSLWAAAAVSLAAAAAPVALVAQQAVSDIGVAMVTTIQPGFNALGIPVVKPHVFRGLVTTVSAGSITVNGSFSLTAGKSYYVEVFGEGAAPAAGERIDVASVAGSTINLNLAAPHNTANSTSGLAIGMQVIVREHWTIGDVGALLGSSLQSGTPVTGDRVYLWTGVTWFSLYRDAAGWIDPNEGEALDPVVPPGTAFFYFRNPAGPVAGAAANVTWTGIVRLGNFVLPIAPGFQFVSLGYPLDRTANQLGLNGANGFVSGANQSTADTFYVFSTAWAGYFLTAGGWIDPNEGEPVGDLPFFGATRGVFLKTSGAARDLVLQRPFTYP